LEITNKRALKKKSAKKDANTFVLLSHSRWIQVVLSHVGY